MKKILIYVVMFLFVCVTNAGAVKDPNKVTTWNRFTDFFATVGKSDEAKKSILKDRKNNRRMERVFDNKQATKKKTQNKMRNQNEAILENISTKKVPHSRGGVDAR